MKTSLGIVYKRRENILNILKERKTVMVPELAEMLKVSEITIRRDLQLFEDDGIVERFYGGAKFVESFSPDQKLGYINSGHDKIGNVYVKDKIAQRAAEFVHENDTIFVNSGSTAFLLLKYLSDKNVTIITNNGKVISQNQLTIANLVVSGGEIYKEKQSLIGDFAISTFSKVTGNTCFLGVGGIDDKGVTTFALPETAVNRTMLERTRGSRIVIAEGYKVGRKNNFVTSDLKLITHLITDATACKKTIKSLEAAGVEVIIIEV